MHSVKVKICGLSRPEDIDFVNEARPDYCGFIVNFPKSRRNVTVETLRSLQARLSPNVTPVGVFVNAPLELVADLLNESVISVAQLHGDENEVYIANLKARLTDASVSPQIWRAIQLKSCNNSNDDSGAKTITRRLYVGANFKTHRAVQHVDTKFKSRHTARHACTNFMASQIWHTVRRKSSVCDGNRTNAKLTAALKSNADFLLFDAGQGDGQTFNWSLLAGVTRDFGLAGGLDANNVREAIAFFTGNNSDMRLKLVDVSSGVESSPGVKDRDKILEFVSLVRRESSN